MSSLLAKQTDYRLRCLLLLHHALKYAMSIAGNSKQAGVATASVAVKGSGSSSVQASAGGHVVPTCAPGLCCLYAVEVYHCSCLCSVGSPLVLCLQ